MKYTKVCHVLTFNYSRYLNFVDSDNNRDTPTDATITNQIAEIALLKNEVRTVQCLGILRNIRYICVCCTVLIACVRRA